VKIIFRLRPRGTRWQLASATLQEALRQLTGATSATTEHVKALKVLGVPLETYLTKPETKIEL
jgi:hypothetical protein